MITRWMKQEGTTLCTLFYFLLFMLNKIKINIFLSVIWLSVQYKNTSKIKVLQMPWKLNMIFLEYLRIYGTKNTPGGQPPCHEGGGHAHPLGRAPCLVGPQWPSSTYSCTHPLLLPPTNTKNKLKHEFQPSLLPFSISLLKAPFTKLLWGIVPWYVTPPMVQLVFVLVLYSLQICAA